jgi:adenylate cyclase
MPISSSRPSPNSSTGSISRLGLWVGVGTTIVLALLTWLAPAVLVRLDNTALDFQFKLRGERNPGDEIVLVLVDEKSLKEEGRWPWSRRKQAQLVDVIRSGDASVIGLDIIYAEPEELPLVEDVQALVNDLRDRRLLPLAAAQAMNQRLAEAQIDRQFAQSLASSGNVVLATPFFVPELQAVEPDPIYHQSTSNLLARNEFMLVKQSQAGEGLQPYRATAVLLPLESIAQAAKGLGHVYRLPDHDGVTRREVLALRYQDRYYPSFALEVARLYLGIPREQVALSLGEGVRFGPQLLPTDPKSRAVINYAGRDLRFPWISATDVLGQRVPPGLFRGKVVLVGTAALGTYDQLSTPFSANFSGVEKNATVVENILHGQFLTIGLWAGPVEVGLVLLVGFVLSVTLPRVRAFHGALVVTALGLAYVGFSQYVFVADGLSLPLVMPTLTIGLVFMGTTVLSYAVKERQAREIHAMFSSYVSPRIVQELMKHPSRAMLGGERKELTMLFADLVGFTPFSEKRQAEQVVGQLNEYLGAMTEVIFKWNGTLDKFVGDEIVVFWGAPLDQPDHVELAVHCAVEMRARLAELQERWKAEGKPVLDNGIGLNTGMALVGNIGAEGKKMDYTMIGDQVNLAARFQGLTRTLGHPILLTEHTAVRLEPMLTAQHAGDFPGDLRRLVLQKVRVVTVKGREEPVAAYTVGWESESEATSSRAVARAV